MFATHEEVGEEGEESEEGSHMSRCLPPRIINEIVKETRLFLWQT